MVNIQERTETRGITTGQRCDAKLPRSVTFARTLN